MSACGGGGGDNGNGTPPPANTTVTISGTVTFERIEFKSVVDTGLNLAAPRSQPARLVTVEALDGTNASSSAAVLASTTTNDQGGYSLQVPANRSVRIRAKAQMVKSDGAPTWNFSVRNNTSSDALYAIEGASSDSGSSSSTRDLNASSGWSGTSYVATRAAAPFAILDTIYTARALILSAAGSTVFPELKLYWSPTNRATADDAFCTTNGGIGTTFYTAGGPSADNCTDGGALAAGIYILGDFADGNGDTDEFDQHVIAHEFGHYVEHSFSRSDSIGGDHQPDDRLDLRLAFSEGWGDAYSGMVLNDPVYRDSFRGVSLDGGFNLESDTTTAPGWFSETSVRNVFWDLFDPTADANDNVALGFAPLYSVMTGAQKSTDALTSVFSFAEPLRLANPAQASAINAVLTAQSISTSDIYGNNETNAGTSTTALPIYQDITLGQPLTVCGSGTDTARNKLGYRRFLRLSLSAQSTLTITAAGAVGPAGSVAATDPDIYVYQRGVTEQVGDSEGSATETISQKTYGAGVHVIEVYDYALGANMSPHCMTVSITGG